MFCSCTNETDYTKTKDRPNDKNYIAFGGDGIKYDVVVVDSCEYINHYDRMAHKGNYRFCKERNENGQVKSEIQRAMDSLRPSWYDEKTIDYFNKVIDILDYVKRFGLEQSRIGQIYEHLFDGVNEK